MCNGYVFSPRIRESVPSVMYFKSSQIYLFDRILATSCSVRKQIYVFMFHNNIQTIDKIQPLPFAKI